MGDKESTKCSLMKQMLKSNRARVGDIKPTKCCGCIPLKHGTITIGVLQSFFGLIGLMIALAVLPSVYDPVLFIFMVVVCASHFVFAYLLVIGTTSGRAALFLPWLTLRILSAIAMVVVMFIGMFAGGGHPITYLSCASAILDWFLASVVFGCRQELLLETNTTQLEEEEERP